MKRIPLIENKTILQNRESRLFRYFAWPTVTRLPDGTLLTVYYQYNPAWEAAEIRQCIWRLPEGL